MNYRHAFHAGNHADVLKHLVLARVLEHLRRKPTPFRALDTHAGIGFYDLSGSEAGRTGEWEGGWGRMAEPFPALVEELLAPYRAGVAAVRARHGESVYPGSPALIREALRAPRDTSGGGDRGVFCELHPADAGVLRERYNDDPRTKVLALDGWTALNAHVPPPERRGLVLIDPPFEVPGEWERLAAGLRRALAKWETGTVLAWYPIKERAAVEGFHAAVAGWLARPALRLDLMVERPDDLRLTGSGLLVVNPPWRLAEEAALFLPALAERLARGEYGAFRCEAVGAPA